MIRLATLGAALLSLAALMSGGAVLARVGGSAVPALAGLATEIPARMSAAPSSAGENLTHILRSSSGTVDGMPSSDVASNISVSALPSRTNSVSHNGNQGNQNDWEGDGADHDRSHEDAPTVNPEASAILSFGVALLIGAGVLLLGRLREARK